MKSLNKYIHESILSSTSSGANSIIMSNMIKYLKGIKDGGQKHGVRGPEEIYIYTPGASRETKLDGVFKFWFPKKENPTKISQFYKNVMLKSGYKSEYDATGDLTLSYDFRLSKVQDKIYYSTLEQYGNEFWESRIFKIGEVYVIFSFIKYSKPSIYSLLYVYLLNPDMTISQNITNEIKKALS